jgi:hypothetical protein
VAQLQIDLQDGFDHDHVVVCVDGDQVVDRPDVNTRTQIGLAESVRHEVAPGRVLLEVAVKSRNVSWKRELDVTQPTVVGLSLTKDNRIVERTSESPFGFGYV